jgi:DNA-binding response OmpR family regulator
MRARTRILIVEDDVPLRSLFRTALKMAGFDVRDVGDGYEALLSLEDHPPDLVVLDLALPRVQGQSVREEMLAGSHTRDIPVVVVTGSTGPEIYQLNADWVLTKPIEPERLVEVVQKCLSSSGPRHASRS